MKPVSLARVTYMQVFLAIHLDEVFYMLMDRPHTLAPRSIYASHANDQPLAVFLFYNMLGFKHDLNQGWSRI